MIPEGCKLILEEPSRGIGDNPNKLLIEYADTSADLAIFGETLTGDVTADGSGSRAAAVVHASQKQLQVMGGVDWLATTWDQQVTPVALMLNFGNTDEAPSLIVDREDKEDPTVKVQRDEVLFNTMKLPVEASWLYTRHDVPQPGPDAELFNPQEPVAPPAFGGFGAKEGLASKSDAVALLRAREVKPEVLAAVERLPDAAAIQYAEQLLECMSRQKPGQRKGGQFRPTMDDAIEQRIHTVIACAPQKGGHPMSRGVSEFGMPDNSEEWKACGGPGRYKEIDDMARRLKKAKEVPIASLKTTRGDVEATKLLGMMDASVPEDTISTSPVVATLNGVNWIADGHHRTTVAMLRGKKVIRARVVNLDAKCDDKRKK